MYEGIRVSAIVAVAANDVIGVEGDLPWHIPGDLKFFKRTTSGHAMIMGRRTWESLPGVLPKRPHVVVSRAMAEVDHPAVTVVRSLEDALAKAAELERERPVDEREIMVVGGGQLYAALWPWVDRLYRTRVHLSPEGDTRFPAVDMSRFTLSSETPGQAHQGAKREGEPRYVFEVWDRLDP